MDTQVLLDAEKNIWKILNRVSKTKTNLKSCDLWI